MIDQSDTLSSEIAGLLTRCYMVPDDQVIVLSNPGQNSFIFKEMWSKHLLHFTKRNNPLNWDLVFWTPVTYKRHQIEFYQSLKLKTIKEKLILKNIMRVKQYHRRVIRCNRKGIGLRIKS